jgi:glucan phosphorylase
MQGCRPKALTAPRRCPPLSHPRREQDPKFVYYLSAEFLMGRTLTTAVYNMGLQGEYGEVSRAGLD